MTTDRATLHLGDCRDILPTLPDASIDCVISDPPYPHIKRPYGCLTEAEWWSLMMDVVRETRRVLKPTGSAVFILQPNSRKVGSMRGWLFEFQAWACREWNMVQDAWWWNCSALPMTKNDPNLLRPSVKACVWLGASDCYRRGDDVAWQPCDEAKARSSMSRAVRYAHGGVSLRDGDMYSRAVERRGTTAFNLLPMRGYGHGGHPAATPEPLADWWTRYICPPDGAILDPFCGSATMGLAALRRGRRFVGIESRAEYHEIAERRLAEEIARTPLLAECGA